MKKLVVLIICFLVALSFYLFWNSDSRSSSNQQEISLIEAIKKGGEFAQNWNPKASLIDVTSVDDPSNANPSEGADGKRKNWNMVFGDVQTGEALIINIQKGKINTSSEIKQTFKINQAISIDSIKIDSPGVLATAKNMFDLLPGTDWAIGYHFLLTRDNIKTFIGVVGLSEGKLTKIYFDAVTGEYTGRVSNK
ncbi:hypothetical protein [Paenibacillus odorifer]|uniref:hypothetical protein n=1 Tax=Paenibacillus odorifer TaxID=189426 RepID=UPI00096DF2B4|nr:hypothetical protein [Paenibacillus odorifer]OMD08204.1 hypothetical protein BJP47_30080 [Paenibacillus odorifer]